jgi:hypothetical protein
MFDVLQHGADEASRDLIRHNSNALPVAIPPGHVGPVVLPGSGRMIWWTGRVAIGLRHQPQRNIGAFTQSALWIQDVLLNHGGQRVSAA